MTDRDISLNSLASAALWAVGVSVVVAALAADAGPELSALGVVSACAGATLSVRGFVREACILQREAFQIGRDYEAGGGGRMRSLR